jgi:hypothetical protein
MILSAVLMVVGALVFVFVGDTFDEDEKAAAMVFLAGIICASIGFFGLRHEKNLKESCTISTIGTVVDMVRGSSRKRKTLYPVFQYIAGGRMIKKKSSWGGFGFAIGQEVTIFYNPENVEEYYVKDGAKSAKFFWYVFLVTGALCLAFSVKLLD